MIGVIGTFNSDCAKLVIPIANRESLAMVSPANTYPGLTEGGPGTEAGEPDDSTPPARGTTPASSGTTSSRVRRMRSTRMSSA